MADMQPENKDLHLDLYNRVLGVNYTKLSDEQRKQAKILVYCYLYRGVPEIVINTPSEQYKKERILTGTMRVDV
jgi:hypothetical protein